MINTKRLKRVLFSCEGSGMRWKFSAYFGSIMVNNDAANRSIDDTDKKAKGTSKTFGEMIGSAAKVGAGIALAMGTAALAVGGLAVKFSDDLQKSLNGVQASTGIADEQMIGMKDTMLAIYNNNFGADFAEIGAAMALINQQTGLSGEALQGVTENALALKDTFGMEVETSILGANQLMKQFGLTGEESYNLIAQGAQWGLDANGDLLDTLREYSGTFAAQGFSAEEMFNMLQNGAASGVRDVDLLADAVKEFGIRSVDGSKASAEGFKALGLNAGQMTKDFAKGGDTAKVAFNKTVTALLAMKDPVAQNAAGVALFGTQFEDLGIKGITALVNTKGEIDKTKDALAKINDVKYNTATEAIQGIKRNLETGILLPLGKDILPMLQKFQTWVIANMPMIKDGIGNAMTTVASAFKTVSDFITVEVLPRLRNIGYIAKDIAEIYFPSLGISTGNLSNTLSDLVLGAMNLVMDALKWIRDNSFSIKVSIEVITFAFLAYNSSLLLVKVATQAVIIWTNLHKAAIVAQTLVMTLGTAAHYGYIVAMQTGSLWLGIVAAKQWLLNAALTANPIGLTVLAILGLIAVLITVTGKWDAVTGAIKRAWEWLTTWNNKKADDKSSTITTNRVDNYSSGKMLSSHDNTPKNAKGTDNWRGGATWINDGAGGEIVDLPKGTRIIPNDISKEMAKNSGGPQSANVTINLDGKMIAHVIAPFSDILQGKGVSTAGRAVGV